LGFKTVKSIVLAASVYKFMDGSFSGYALDRGELWRHSLSVAFAARRMAKKLGGSDDEEAYVAGMVHDLGKIVLNDYVRFGYGIIARLVEEDRVPFMDAEKQVLGFDHAQVGGLIMEQWNLPEPYIYTARYHHTPEELPEEGRAFRRVVDIVHAANALCLMLGAGIGADGLQYYLSPEAMERLGIGDIEPWLSELVDLMAQVDEELRMEEAV
jgi:putative nucleotidyltransferase with HDIG domain